MSDSNAEVVDLYEKKLGVSERYTHEFVVRQPLADRPDYVLVVCHINDLSRATVVVLVRGGGGPQSQEVCNCATTQGASILKLDSKDEPSKGTD